MGIVSPQVGVSYNYSFGVGNAGVSWEAMKPLLILFVLAMLALGTVCTFFPQSVQSIAERAVEVGPVPGVVKAFVRSNRYLWNVRTVGILAFIAALLLLIAGFRMH